MFVGVPDVTWTASLLQEMLEAAKSDGKQQPGVAKYPEQDLLQALLSDKQVHSYLDAS